MMNVRVHSYSDLLSRSGHRLRNLKLQPGATVAQALEGLELGPKPAVLLNGRPVHHAAQDSELLSEGDELHAAPGFGGPETWVMIAIAVAATAASAVLARTLAPKPSSSSEANEERRYGWNRFSNDARAGDPIPVVYGRRRYGGRVVNRVPVEDARGTGDSRLRILICLGWGPIAAIGNQAADFDDLPADQVDGVYLNDQPISTFTGVKVSGRLGSEDQAPISRFDDSELLRDVGVGGTELRNTYGAEPTGGQTADAVSITTSGEVDAVVVRVRFPAGLYNVSRRSQLETRSVKFRTRHREVGGAWSAWTDHTVTQAQQSAFFASPRLEFPTRAQREVQVQRVSVEVPANDPSAQDRMLWDSIVEVQDTEHTYPGLAMLALELTANEQVQTVPRISADVLGRVVRTYAGGGPGSPQWSEQWSDNPAEVALDLLTDTRYGLGAMYGDGRVDFDSWIAWRDYCAELVTHPSGRQTRRHGFNMALDAHRDGVEWLRTVAAAGRAVPATVGGTWRFIVDRPQLEPVEVFTDGSIAVDDNGVAQITYRRELATGAVRRPNRLVLQFENGTEGDQPDVVAYPELGEHWLGGPGAEQVREQSGRLDGITDPDQALAEAVYRMRRLRFQTRTVRFRTTRQAVVVQPGDRFDLASSLPGYSVASGRLLDSSTAAVVRLDQGVYLEHSSTYQLRVLHLDGSTETRTVSTSGTVPAGAPLQLSAPLSQAPSGAEFALLRDQVELKPYLCTRVECEDTDTLQWSVEGIEYVADVYAPDPAAIVTVPTYSTLADPNTPPGPVRDLRVFERLVPRVVVGESGEPQTLYVNQIELSWSQAPADAENTATFRVYRRIVGTVAWLLIPEPKISRRSAVLEISDLQRGYQFTVVAVSLFGAALSPYDPRLPIASLALNSQDDPPPPPTGLQLEQVSGNHYTLRWDAVEGAVEYQVLTGRDTDAQVNSGAFDCYVQTRTPNTSVGGLYLTPGVRCTFMVRSVGANGRMSRSAATVSVASPPAPTGRSVANTQQFNLSSSGTLTNLAWAATPTFNGVTQAGRLELSNPAQQGEYLSPEVDLGSTADTVLHYRLGTANDTDDVALNTNPLQQVPGVEADQWGIVQTSPERLVGMLFPPWPDDRHRFTVEYRLHNGTTWGSWTAWPAFGNVQATIRQYQVRVRLARGAAPYRPALRALAVVASR